MVHRSVLRSQCLFPPEMSPIKWGHASGKSVPVPAPKLFLFTLALLGEGAG